MIKEQDNKLFIFSIIKIILLVLLLVYIGILFAMKGNSKTPFSVVAEKVDKEMKAESLIKADGQLLKRYYGLNDRNYEGVLLYVSESAMDVSEVLFVKVNDNTQIDEVERAVDTRVKTQKKILTGMEWSRQSCYEMQL